MHDDAARTAAAYLPLDRRQSLAENEPLPARADGAILFADISGFTPLTELCVQAYGPQRGAEETTRHLNRVYTVLIAELHEHGGCVVGFSGDGMMCWFAGTPASAARHALMCGQRLQEELARMAHFDIDGQTLVLGLKVAIAAGTVRRMAVGDPALHLVDVIAGAPVDAAGRLETYARAGEVVVDAQTIELLRDEVDVDWRETTATSDGTNERLAVLRTLHTAMSASRLAIPATPPCLTHAQVRPWLAPTIYARLETSAAGYLAEIRPAVALFLRFDWDSALGADSLDQFIRWVQQVLIRFDGTLIQLTTGDKGSYLYAAFGAPVAHGNDAIRAVAAALVLCQPPVDIALGGAVQIGVARGRMRVGPYGSEARRTYGVQGAAVNLAARLMMLAKRGQILLDRPMAQAAGSLFDITELGRVAVKGMQQEIAVFSVGERSIINDLVQQSSRQHALIGRKPELAALDAALERALEGQGLLVRIEAEAGLGKSRLLAAFAKQIGSRRLFLAMAACHITTRETAYSAVRQIGRQLFGLDRAELTDDDARRAQVVELLRQLNPSLLPRMPLLGEALGLLIPENEVTVGLEPRQRQEAFLSLAVEIIRELATFQPVVMLVEDLHWLDEASAELLLALMRAAKEIPLLIVATQRPAVAQTDELFSRIDRISRQETIRLSELSDGELAGLADARLGGGLSPLALDFVQRQAQGNPFFAEELIDALQETGDLRQVTQDAPWELAPEFVARLQAADCLSLEDGTWRLAADASLAASAVGIPDSIHGIVLARLDRLPDQVQLTVKTASVIGRVFELTLLQHAHPIGMTLEAIRHHLRMLENRDFARLESVEPDPVYLFKHNITQEVAYQTLLDRQRRQLHQTVGETLEALRPDAVERLALHYSHSDTTDPPVRSKALHFLDAASRRAMRDYANEIALGYLDGALELESSWMRWHDKARLLHILGRRNAERDALAALASAPDAHASTTQLLWAEYYDAVGDYEQARRALEDALRLSLAEDDLRGAARCHARRGLIAWRQGDYAEAHAAYDAGLSALAGETDALAEEADIRYGLGLVYRHQANYERAEAEFQRNLDAVRVLQNRLDEARGLNALASIAFMRGNYGAAQEHNSAALDLRRTIGDRMGEASGLMNQAQLFRHQGEFAQAEALLARALTLFQQLDDPWRTQLVWNELGIVCLLTGRLAAAEERLRYGLEIGERLASQSTLAYVQCNLGQVLALAGRHAEAEEQLTASLATARRQEDRLLAATTFTELANVQLARGRAAEAISSAQAAMEEFDALQQADATIPNLVTLAAAHLALDQPDEARLWLRQAEARLTEAEIGELDYPQRDYFTCAQAWRALEEKPRADAALQAAAAALQAKADRLADAELREAFLHGLPFNRAIVEAMEP